MTQQPTRSGGQPEDPAVVRSAVVRSAPDRAADARDVQRREQDGTFAILTAPQARGAIRGGVIGALVGAIVLLPLGFIRWGDALSLGWRMLLCAVVGALAGGTYGMVLLGGAQPEREAARRNGGTTASPGVAPGELGDIATADRAPGGEPLHLGTIVVGEDGSADSRAAVDFAHRLGELLGSDTVTAISAPDGSGDAAQQLSDSAAQTGADLIVVGTHPDDASGTPERTSVVQRLAHLHDGPIAAVHDHADPAVLAAGTRVIVGVDGSAGSAQALRWAASLARAIDGEHGVPIAVLAHDPVADSYPGAAPGRAMPHEDDARRQVEECARGLGDDITLRVEPGVPFEVIDHLAQEMHPAIVGRGHPQSRPAHRPRRGPRTDDAAAALRRTGGRGAVRRLSHTSSPGRCRLAARK